MRRMGRAIGASVVLLILTFSGYAQDKQNKEKKEPAPAAPQDKKEPAAPPQDKKEPAAPPQDNKEAPAAQDKKDTDRIDIGNALDSWYSILEKAPQDKLDKGEEKAIGFSHEVITRMPQGSPWLYSYDLNSEIDTVVMVEGKPGTKMPEIHATNIHADLDDTFAPVHMSRQDLKGAAALPTRVFTDETSRKIDVELANDNKKQFTVNPDEEIFYSRFLMFIALRQAGALSRPGTRKAILMHPREDGSPPYAEVTIEIKEAIKREVMGKKDVMVTPITYLKPPPASTTEDELLSAYIDRFGRIVEEETRRSRQILVKSEKEALGDRPFIQSARRDPFKKEAAFTRGGRDGVKPTGPRGDKPPVGPGEAVAKNFLAAKNGLEALQKAKTEKRDAEGEKIYQQVLDIIDALIQTDARWPLSPQDKAMLLTITADVEKIWGGLDRLMKKARMIFVRSTQMFDRDDCAGMEAGVKEIKLLLTDRAVKNAPSALADLHKWIGQLEPLVVRCKTRLDLAKKKLVLTGTTLSDVWEQVPVDVRLSVFGHQVGAVLDVRFVKPLRIAIVNGKPYRVGDLVDGEGVRVEKIWPHGVQVSLRDETRDVGIRQ
jgi:hypothetical protein